MVEDWLTFVPLTSFDDFSEENVTHENLIRDLDHSADSSNMFRVFDVTEPKLKLYWLVIIIICEVAVILYPVLLSRRIVSLSHWLLFVFFVVLLQACRWELANIELFPLLNFLLFSI